MKKLNKFKKGAASFYIVAIATLILVIIAASFAAVIISEIARTSNDDLAQSAYDSALAGIEDAKLAYYNYQKCQTSPTLVLDNNIRCSDVINWVENGRSEEECDMVADILGREVVKDEDGNELGVLVQEDKSASNNMQQYYTCVTMTNMTKDVLGSLSETDASYSVRVNFGDSVKNDDITKVRINWHSNEDGNENEFKYATFPPSEQTNFGFIFDSEPLMPAVISLGMVQTGETFKLSDFDMTVGNQTDRGTVYLVPTNNANLTAVDGGYKTAWDSTKNLNIIGTEGFLKSNDKTAKNLPYAVYCNGDDYACSVDVEIPKPIGGTRNEDTFVFTVSLPYGAPNTHFSLEFFYGDASTVVEGNTGNSGQATLEAVQIKVDSTGRANDLYRRIETRLETTETAYPYPLYAIQALGKSGNVINKALSPTCEYDFSPTCQR